MTLEKEFRAGELLHTTGDEPGSPSSLVGGREPQECPLEVYQVQIKAAAHQGLLKAAEEMGS